MVRMFRSSAPAPRAARWFLLAGLASVGAGCSTSNVPEEQKTTVQKVEDGAANATNTVVDATGSGLKATGEAIEKGGEKLATDAADSVKKNVGETAGNIVESTGKGLEKAGEAVDKGGEKLKEAVPPKE